MRASLENPNIRISRHSKATLRDLAKRAKKSMQAVLDEAIEQYRRDKFFEELNSSYTRLQQDRDAWKQELAERQEWDATLADGLEDE
jgi:predicted transcriptional regulator